jgi:long-chain acyl-CoA synthetase
LRKDAPAIEHFICINARLSGTENYDEIILGSHAGEPARSIDENDVVVLGYTGGTTGKPKGVMTTHRNLITSCYNTVVERELSSRDIFLNALPVFHAGGANSMFAFAFLGATNVFMSASSIETILQTVEAHRVTDFVLVPTQIMSLLENPNVGKYDLSSIKAIYYGTAPISVEPLKKLMRLMKCKFSQTYGMTETFVPISILKPEDHVVEGDPEAVRRLGSAGRAVMGVKVKIVDNSDREVETGQVGEIVVSGKNVMKGYWNLPELTREVLKDGWLHTGDMGKMDELGYLYVVDRKKDMIISGGENIYAKEVEDVLSSHPEVSHAVVIGVPDEKWGEAVKGLVIREKGSRVSEEELIDFCKSRLASYKKPRSIEFMEEFPKSTAGKVLKRELEQKYWKGREKKI